MAFIESRLLECVSYGTEGGPTWRTRKVPLKSGIIRRNPRRAFPLYQFRVVYNNLLPTDHDSVIEAFNACMGGLHSFRLKDHHDYLAVVATLEDVGTGAAQSVQLTKPYTFGTQTMHRRIRKPVTGTVQMWHNGAPLTASINYTTGVATFTATAAAVLTWSGEFDVPVMFEEDELAFAGVDKGAEGLFLSGDVPLIEDCSV